MFRIVTVSYNHILIGAAIGFGLIIIGLILFKRFWIKKVAFAFPAADFEDETLELDNRNRIVAHTLREHFACIFARLFPLEPTYWIKKAGFDGSFVLLSLLFLTISERLNNHHAYLFCC